MPRADGSFSAFVTETLRLSSFVQIFVRSLAPSLANSVCMGSGGLAARHVPPPYIDTVPRKKETQRN